MKKSNLFKQILAYTLVLSVIFSQIVFSFGASAAEVNSVWDGTKAENFAGGDGSAASPFLIDTAEQLYKMVVEYSTRTASEGKYFKITNDLYLNDVADGTHVKDLAVKENWLKEYGTSALPNGSTTNAFAGNLDGNGHTIYGLYTKGAGRSGLFHTIIQGTVIKNLSFENIYLVDGKGYGGAIAGRAHWVNGKSNAQITNCSVNNAVIGGDMEYTGGLIGNMTDCNADITNCFSYDVSLSNWESKGLGGGIFGNINAGSSNKVNLTNCYSAGNFVVNSKVNKTGGDIKCTNVYTNIDVPAGNSETDVTVLTDSQMKGENAKTNMTGFNFKYTWETVDGSYPVFKSDPVYVWDGTVATSYDGFKGSGTAEDPYLIENGAQLAFAIVTSSSNGYYFKLVKDIILNDTSYEGWQSSARSWIQNTDYRFNGELDGDGHIIEGLYFNKSSGGRYGLIAYTGKLASGNDHVATVKNIKFVGASITNTAAKSDPTQGAAVVAGQASGETIFENIIIDETSSVIAPNIKGVAGIVGRGYNKNTNAHVTIRNCAVLGTINGGDHTGAFCGTFWDPNLVITIDNSFADTTYGLIGDNAGKVAITNTYTNVLGDKDTGAVQVDSDKMIGAAAKENMPGLDFACIWETVEGSYPVLRKDPLYGWDGTKAENFAGGTGTKNDPFLIENGGQLYKMVADYSNADITVKPEVQTYFKITKDINLGGKQWYTITVKNWLSDTAYSTIGFNGIIYGEGHTIFGLNNNTAAGAVGLIPVATQGTQIYDLHLENGNLPRVNYQTYAVGALIGLARSGDNSSPIIIEGCSVKGFTIASCYGSAAFVGYLYSQSITIKNSYCVNTALSHTAESSANSAAFIGYTNGNEYGNKIIIKNSHCSDLNPKPYLSEKFEAITTFENVYTANEAYDGSVDGLTKLTAAQMTGVAAKANMAGFNFNQIWQNGAEGEYPTHKTNEEKAMYWNGTSADSFAGGQGTINNPYEISTADQLFLLANAGTEATKGKYFKLTRDINISKVYEGWENDNPYSWTKKTAYLDGFGYSNSFAGTLDGAGYTVRGLYYTDEITNNGTYAYGLIPFVSANAVIKNLNVENVAGDVTGNAYMGAVAGAAHVTETDVANALNMVQFVGVNLANSDLALLGGASRGVKFELCNAEEFIGSESEKISVRNCNNENYSYNDNVLIYNALNADSNALANAINYLLGNQSNYITEINGDASFDIRDLVSIKKYLAMGSSDDYKLVWSQEFNGNVVDYSVLTTNKTMSVGSTLKYADNAVVNNGSLKLSCSDTGTTDTNGDKIYSVNYGLSTIDTMSFKYGKLEMRAKVPFAAAAFPSLWLTSRNAIGYETNSEYSNEIDIFEMFGKTNNNDTLISCIHKWYNDENGNRVLDENGNPVECSCGSGILAGNGYKVAESDRDYQITGDAQNEYHTFVFEWDENSMSFSVDGNVYYTARKSEMSNFDISGYNTSAEGIFEQFLCIRLNNHMYTTGDGAAYKYSGDATEIDPSKINFEIDYIRLYQKDNGKINLK